MRISRLLPEATVIISWLIFIISFALPTTNVLEAAGNPPGTPMSGLQTFYACISVVFVLPLLVITEPRILAVLLFPFVNIGMLFAPLVIFRWDHSWFFTGVFFLFGLSPLLLPSGMISREHLFIGFYLWNGSCFAMAAGCLWLNISRRRYYDCDRSSDT